MSDDESVKSGSVSPVEEGCGGASAKETDADTDVDADADVDVEAEAVADAVGVDVGAGALAEGEAEGEAAKVRLKETPCGDEAPAAEVFNADLPLGDGTGGIRPPPSRPPTVRGSWERAPLPPRPPPPPPRCLFLPLEAACSDATAPEMAWSNML